MYILYTTTFVWVYTMLVLLVVVVDFSVVLLPCVVVVEVDTGETVGWTKSLKTMFTVANELLNIIHEINNNNNNNNKIKQAKTAKVEKNTWNQTLQLFLQ